MMNKFNKTIISNAILCMSLTTSAMAADVTINVTGKVIASSCTVDNSGIYNIDLGQNISASTLNSANSYTSWKPFNVTLSSCPAGTTKVTATFAGTADTNDNTQYANATSTGSAQNVSVQLQNTTVGANVGNGSTMTVNVSNSAATFPLQARAYSTKGGATPGNITASVMLNMSYN